MGSLTLLLAIATAADCRVTSNADTPTGGTLRACILATNAAPGRDTITFDAVGTILVTQTLPPTLDVAGTVIDGLDSGVVLDCTGAADCFKVESSNTVLRGLALYRSSGAGIYVGPGSHRVVLSQLDIQSHDDQGIYFDGPNEELQVLDSLVASNGNTGIELRENRWDGGSCTTRSIVARNVIRSNGASMSEGGLYAAGVRCVDVYENDIRQSSNTALKITSSSRGVRAFRNVVRDNLSEGVGVYGGAAFNEVTFNFIANNVNEGINAGDTGSTDNLLAGNVIIRSRVGVDNGVGINSYGGGDRTRVFNNTVVANAGEGILLGNTAGSIARNNLAAFNLDTGVQFVGTGTSADHNLSFGNTGGDFGGAAVRGPTDPSCDPGFVDAGADDYRLASCGSCAVDRGLDLGAQQPDLTGAGDAVSFWGPAPDLGALESTCGRPALPAISGTPVADARCGEMWTYQPTVTGMLSIARGPPDATVDVLTGTVRWTPTVGGDADFTLDAMTMGGTVQQTFAVHVTCDDAGAPRKLRAACGCTSAPGVALLLLVLSRARRAARPASARARSARCSAAP